MITRSGEQRICPDPPSPDPGAAESAR